MWFIETETDRKKREEAQRERLLLAGEAARAKSEARAAWLAGKCPHCGRNDPMPPWLY